MDKKHERTTTSSSTAFNVPKVKESTKSSVQQDNVQEERQSLIQRPVSHMEAQRISKNKRFIKKNGMGGRTGRHHYSETGSNKSSEEESLIAAGRHKAARSGMSRAKALSTLGLEHYPMPYEITSAANALLAKFHPEEGGNIRKYQAVVEAQKGLLSQQSRIFKQFEEDFKTDYLTYQKTVEPIVRDRSKDRETNKAAVEVIHSLGKKLHDLGLKYFQDLKEGKQNSLELTSAYDKEYSAVINDQGLQHLTLNERKSVMLALHTLSVDIVRCDRHLPFAFQQKLVIEDPIDAFETKHNDYLRDIQELRNDYPNYHQAFDVLSESLENLGIGYLRGLRDGGDIEQLSQEYAKGFNEAVEKAEQAFETEPSIWQNLHPIVKAICTLIFVIKWCIYAAETEVDRHRMYHPDKISIQERWKRWEMDCMPQLDKAGLQQVRSSEKS